MESTYNMDYAAADRTFDAVIAADPEHPQRQEGCRPRCSWEEDPGRDSGEFRPARDEYDGAQERSSCTQSQE